MTGYLTKYTTGEKRLGTKKKWRLDSSRAVMVQKRERGVLVQKRELEGSETERRIRGKEKPGLDNKDTDPLESAKHTRYTSF